MDELLTLVKESLEAICHPRYYRTERGFQAEFLSVMKCRLPSSQWEGVIIEQEYQKKMKEHGINLRPDVIIHVPFEESRLNSRREGNLVVFELKLMATVEKALDAYQHLSKICEVLEYPLGIFININASNTYFNQYQGSHKENIHAFAVNLQDNRVEVFHDSAS